MSSRAWVVDLVHSIGEKTALADHLEEKLIANEDIETNKRILDAVLSLRREQMSYLLEQADKPNPTRWCDFKHSIKSFIHDTEVYEATGKDDDLERLKKSSDILAMEISLFLGMEFETCARCLADQLLVVEHNKKANLVELNKKQKE